MAIERVPVRLGDRSYEIRIGHGLIERAAEEIQDLLSRPRVVVVTDANLKKLYYDSLNRSLQAHGIQSDVLELAPGELTKSWTSFQKTVEWLLSLGLERRDLLIALGGGVIGDLAGFAAAVVMRGIRYVQIPTSLLAMVDSSMGGKTGINSDHGKNLVGAFHQPSRVLADLAAIRTLPRRDCLAGYGEIAKYGLLGDKQFFSWLEANGRNTVAGDKDCLAFAIKRSCEIKAEIVCEDEHESGRRSLLNLGHTFGHALEAATGYSDRLKHGEAVSIGCCLAFELSRRLGYCDLPETDRVNAHFLNVGAKSGIRDIPGKLPGVERLFDFMLQDKKSVGGNVRFVLAYGIGKAFLAERVPKEAVLNLLSGAGR